jgi:hypothetical protein
MGRTPIETVGIDSKTAKGLPCTRGAARHTHSSAHVAALATDEHSTICTVSLDIAPLEHGKDHCGSSVCSAAVHWIPDSDTWYGQVTRARRSRPPCMCALTWSVHPLLRAVQQQRSDSGVELLLGAPAGQHTQYGTVQTTIDRLQPRREAKAMAKTHINSAWKQIARHISAQRP